LNIEPVSNPDADECNKTVHLSRDNMKVSITSPGFLSGHFYPDNVNCFTFIVAPTSYRILIEYEELIVENEPQCAYDFVEMFEPSFEWRNVTDRHRRTVASDFPSIQLQQVHEFQQLMRDYEQQKFLARNIFNPSNNTYNTFVPPPSTLSERMPRKICGDWSSKLKLLRYRSKSNSVGVRFSSDYSHHYNGFRAKITLEKGKMN
jgi:CUB domain